MGRRGRENICQKTYLRSYICAVARPVGSKGWGQRGVPPLMPLHDRLCRRHRHGRLVTWRFPGTRDVGIHHAWSGARASSTGRSCGAKETETSASGWTDGSSASTRRIRSARPGQTGSGRCSETRAVASHWLTVGMTSITAGSPSKGHDGRATVAPWLPGSGASTSCCAWSEPRRNALTKIPAFVVRLWPASSRAGSRWPGRGRRHESVHVDRDFDENPMRGGDHRPRVQLSEPRRAEAATRPHREGQ